MRTPLTIALGTLLIIGGFTLAVTMTSDEGHPFSFQSPSTDSPTPASGEAVDDSTVRDGPPKTSSQQHRDGSENLEIPSPLIESPSPDASPLEMTEALLGPTPEDLRLVDPSMTLEEALRQHPAFPDEDPLTTSGVPEAGPVENALARLVQAHGILTEVKTAASQGDPVAQDLAPYAAAQLAEEAEKTGPTFTAASDLLSISTQADLRLNGEAQPVEDVGTLQEEVHRLYGLIGLPEVPVDPGVHDAGELARLVHATANVVEATHQAQDAAERAEALKADMDRFEAALSQGAFSPEDARWLVEVAQTVHEVTVLPIQQRLDALDTLYATSEEIVPHLVLSEHESPIQDLIGDVEDVASAEDILEQVQNETEGIEGTLNETEDFVRSAANETEEGAEDVVNQTEEVLGPLSEPLQDRFVDPFGAIVILGTGDDEVNGTGSPVPVNVPEAGLVGSLFPRAPLLVVAQGGDNTYVDIPRTLGADEAVQSTGEPVVSDDDLPVALDDFVQDSVPEPGLVSAFVDIAKVLFQITYDEAMGTVQAQEGVEVAIVADTPMQVVVDLEGDDTYKGERAAAYAAGGGTAAIYDAGGDDVFDVKKGVGLIEEDGLAIVKSFGGNDQVRVERGVGSALAPFEVNEEGQAVFEDRFSYRVGGLGGYVNFAGDNVYDVEEVGIGLSFHPSLPSGFAHGLPVTVPVALDLGGSSTGFSPVVFDEALEPSVDLERADGDYLRAWTLVSDWDRGHAEPPEFDDDGSFIMIGAGDQAVVLPSPSGFSEFVEFPGLRSMALDRSYEVDTEEPTEGTIRVDDHDVTIESRGMSNWLAGFFPGSSIELHNEILVHLDDTERVYEPPYPMILIDAGDTDDVYHNVTPHRMIANTTSMGPLGFGGENSNVYSDDVTLVPNLVLDTRGDDRYMGQAASLDTALLAHELRAQHDFETDEEQTDVLRHAAAGSVLVDLGGDDTFHGDVASVNLDMELGATTMTSLVHAAGGSNTIQGGQAGGIDVHNAATLPTGQPVLGMDAHMIGHSITALLFIGSQDETDRNLFDVRGGSMGSVYVQNTSATIDQLTRLTAGTAVTGASEFTSTNHSFGSVYWCPTEQDDDACPEVETGTLGAAREEVPQVTALFVAGNEENTYTLDRPEAIGHVSLSHELDVCTEIGIGTVVREDAPHITTRFVDVGAPTQYLMTDRTLDLPPWRNDHSWRTFDRCELSSVGAPILNAEDQFPMTTDDLGAGQTLQVQTVDALSVDNLGQYVLGTAGGPATGTGMPVDLQFEPPELCAGPYAVHENGTVLRGFGLDEQRCSTDLDTFTQDPIGDHERLLVAMETRGNVPANAFGAINPCDTGQSSERFLTLNALEENVPGGNPLAQGTSGCWATLEVRVPPGHARSNETSPVWDRFAPSGVGWLSVMAGPVHCGYTDDSNMPVRCATDAFPVPYHVDGSGGYDLDRWFLPEGTYEYRVTLHGPISTLTGEEVLEGELHLDRDPLAQEGPVPGHAQPVETTQPEGLLSWIEHGPVMDQAPAALEGFTVRVLHQDDDGEPEHIHVESPFRLTSHHDVAPVVCLDGTPYRGYANDASLDWIGDRGTWATTYPLEVWENEPELLPHGCTNVDDPAVLEGPGVHEADVGLWHAPFGEAPTRIALPPSATVDQIVVDEEDPEVLLTPVQDANGEPVPALDHEVLGEIGIGVDDLNAPEVSGHMSTGDLSEGLFIEVDFNVTSQSPIREITFAGATDDPLHENWINATLNENTGEVEGIRLAWDHEDDTDHLWCSPETHDGDVACHTRLNLTRSGQAPDGTWYRHAALNIMLDPTDPNTPGIGPSDHENRIKLFEALERSIQDNEPLTFEIDTDDRLEATDEAGNELSERIRDITLDLSRPSDLLRPCQPTGLEVLTQNDTVTLRTHIPESIDDVELLLIERLQNGVWTIQDWVPLDDTTSVDRHCEEDRQGDWLAFDYTAQDAADGEIVRHELRTIPVDAAGNRAVSFGPFDLVVTVDRKAPTLTLEQTKATPSSLTVLVTSDQPVTLDPDTVLVDPEGDARAPLFVDPEPSTEHELQFEGLTVNTTYTLATDATDLAGNIAHEETPVQSARTLNVSLAENPPVVADTTRILFTAGALGPAQDGDPMTRIQPAALHNGTVCAEPRQTVQHIGAPIDEPARYNATLPLADCPGGELTLELTIENGPQEAPIERITLETTTIRDIEPPTPGLDIDGERSDTGWYTTPVSITPTGDDDTGIQDAYIETEHGPLTQMTLDESGVHPITVTVTDLANRTTTDTLEVPIDLSPPRVELVSQDPLPTERSQITVQVLGQDDASGLDAIRTLQAQGGFTPWSPVVEGMQLRVDIKGLDEIVAEVRDRAGHVTQTVLPVTSLADPPNIEDASVTVLNPGTLHVNAVLDRPLSLEATAEQDGTLVAIQESPRGLEHNIILNQLRPATETTVTVHAHLTDGSTATLEDLSTQVHLPASQGPPTVPENLSADLLPDGTVKLTWDDAQDDAGIDQYLVERRTDGQLTAQRATTSTQMLDEAPAGATHAYRVQALDLAGQPGGWSQAVTVTPTAPLEIVSYDVTPEIQAQGEPVEITIIAQGEKPPNAAHIQLGDDRIPLALEEGNDGRWVYKANVTLPTTDTFFPQGVTLHLDDQTFPEEGTFPGPVVKALADGELSTQEAIPAPGWAAIALALGAALFVRRWTP